METIFFYLVALVAVASGFLVVRCQSPVNSALALVNTFFCLAIFYVMLYAPFMAAIQVIVYAGAIMVLILFVIMLLNLGTEARKRYTHGVVGPRSPVCWCCWWPPASSSSVGLPEPKVRSRIF